MSSSPTKTSILASLGANDQHVTPKGTDLLEDASASEERSQTRQRGMTEGHDEHMIHLLNANTQDMIKNRIQKQSSVVKETNPPLRLLKQFSNLSGSPYPLFEEALSPDQIISRTSHRMLPKNTDRESSLSLKRAESYSCAYGVRERSTDSQGDLEEVGCGL